MKIYQEPERTSESKSKKKSKPEVSIREVSTYTRELELRIENLDNGKIRYTLYDLAYKGFGGFDYLCYSEPLDGFYPLYDSNSKRPFGIARDLTEARDRLMLKVQRRLNRIKSNEKRNMQNEV